jgi:DNA polymerase-3 subunit epsilon
MYSLAKSYAVIDFETSGLSANQGDRAIEVGVAIMEGNNLADTYQSLMNSGVNISYVISTLTGISQGMIDNAPPIANVMGEVYKFVGDLPLVAHNASFDRKFYISELSRIGIDFDSPFLCTMLIGRRLYPYSKNHKLATLAELNNINTTGQHRALADAIMTSKLLNVMSLDLEALHEGQLVDSAFLLRYQQRPKHAVKFSDKKALQPVHSVPLVRHIQQPIIRTPVYIPEPTTLVKAVYSDNKIVSSDEGNKAKPNSSPSEKDSSGSSLLFLVVGIIILLIFLGSGG